MAAVSALVAFVCVLLVEGGGASRWGPTPDGGVGESKRLAGGRFQAGSLEATGRGGAGPRGRLAHFLAAPLAGPIGRLVGQIYQPEESIVAS